MSTARIPDGTPLGLVQVGLATNGSESTVKCLYCLRPYPGDGTFAHHQDWCPLAGRSDPPVKPTSEVAHQPGQQPAASDCGATDGSGFDPDGAFGRCNLPAGHDGDWHQEWRADQLWAEWRGPHPGQRCSICGKDGSEH